MNRGYMVRLAQRLEELEKDGLSLEGSLRAVMLDANFFHQERAEAAELLKLAGNRSTTKALLDLFMNQSEKEELYSTALTLEMLNDRRVVPSLIHALLEDSNPHRRHAAARALGWIRPANRATALALANCLTNPAQPQAARQEAAESLAYAGTRETIDALISMLHDRDVSLRFWAVFGLGGCRGGGEQAIAALESVLDDDEVPPGGWWSVGKEALAMLASLEPVRDRYEVRLRMESLRVLSDLNATEADRRWAANYLYLHART